MDTQQLSSKEQLEQNNKYTLNDSAFDIDPQQTVSLIERLEARHLTVEILLSGLLGKT